MAFAWFYAYYDITAVANTQCNNNVVLTLVDIQTQLAVSGCGTPDTDVTWSGTCKWHAHIEPPWLYVLVFVWRRSIQERAEGVEGVTSPWNKREITAICSKNDARKGIHKLWIKSQNGQFQQNFGPLGENPIYAPN